MKHKVSIVALAIILSVVLSSGTVSANSTETSFFSNDEIINQIEVSLTEGYQEYERRWSNIMVQLGFVQIRNFH